MNDPTPTRRTGSPPAPAELGAMNWLRRASSSILGRGVMPVPIKLLTRLSMTLNA